MDNNGTYERNRKSEVELLWTQFEDLIEHGKNKDANTKLELLQRIYQFLAETLPKSNQEKKVLGLKSFISTNYAGFDAPNRSKGRDKLC
jgi:hypothetical protein